jgi:hypothetical protein
MYNLNSSLEVEMVITVIKSEKCFFFCLFLIFMECYFKWEPGNT